MSSRVSIKARITLVGAVLTLLGAGTGAVSLLSGGAAAVWGMVAVTVVASGLLTAAVTRSVCNDLDRVARELREGAGRVASAAGQVASTSQSMVQGAGQQAASLEETSASAQEISSMAGRNTENTRAAADVVSDSARKFQETSETLDRMVAAMREIGASSDKISKIIKVIDEIAFQTNILALNAAVEAARAGEAGMGFAVVADEVRNLAQRCAQAARETSTLIEESIRNASEGRGRVDQVVTAISAIREESVKIKTLVEEVNQSSGEQARGIEQISRAIAEMERVTQKTAAGAEQSAAAAQQLNGHAAGLTQLVGRLNAIAGIDFAGARPAPAYAAQAHKPAPKTRKPDPLGVRSETPVVAAARIDRDEFPLEGDFREF